MLYRTTLADWLLYGRYQIRIQPISRVIVTDKHPNYSEQVDADERIIDEWEWHCAEFRGTNALATEIFGYLTAGELHQPRIAGFMPVRVYKSTQAALDDLSSACLAQAAAMNERA